VYLDGLNEQQREAVLATDGAVMVLAGAGAGKTKTITHRIAHLIATGVAPEKILAVTFTNKAAAEMRDRIRALIAHNPQLRFPTSEYSGSGPTIGTFHSLGVRLLREFGPELNISKSFTIWDRSESNRAIISGIKALGEDPKQYEPRRILGKISRIKGDGLTMNEFRAEARSPWDEMVVRVWERYEQSLRDEKALDFDDLLLKPYQLLSKLEHVRDTLNERWQYILVDEYQDTNRIQYETARLLAGAQRNICVVGDIDQSIYSWRGADIEHLLSFERAFPGAKVILLEKNYRSTQTILSAANEIIAKNTRRLEKRLVTENSEGSRIGLYCAAGESDEGAFIARACQKLIQQGVPAREIAVLYRANFQSRVLEEQMLAHDIPYQLIGTKFFERKEVKDVFAYLKAALNGGAGDMVRAASYPPRGIGKATLAKILEGKEETLGPAARTKAQDFKKVLDRIADSAQTRPASETIRTILEKSGMQTHLQSEGEEGAERLENIKELVTLATKYDALAPEEGIHKLLEDVALTTDQDEVSEKRTGVSLMTVHASKGLEFDNVFITGLEDGLFPHQRRDEGADDEEERRLFYVALTRARKQVFLSWAVMRTIYGSREMTVPSEFINDIDPSLVEYIGERTRRFAGVSNDNDDTAYEYEEKTIF
jgi:DNA helicase-2/ATP-dependent DNA helicase PcrA